MIRACIRLILAALYLAVLLPIPTALAAYKGPSPLPVARGGFGANFTGLTLNLTGTQTVTGAKNMAGIVSASGYAIGAGEVLTRIRINSGTLTPTSAPANTTTLQSFNAVTGFTGYVVGERIIVNPPSGMPAGLGIANVRSGGASIFRIYWTNVTGSSKTAPTGSWKTVSFRWF